jgi:hypothetical protein
MELLEGEPLDQTIARGGMELNTVLNVCIEIADALDAPTPMGSSIAT